MPRGYDINGRMDRVLTEKLRLKAILENQTIDRPPVICPGGMMSAATTAVLHTTSEDFHSDPLVMAQIAEVIRHKTGFENIGVPFCMTVEAELFGSLVDMGDSSVEPHVTQYGAREIAEMMSRPLPNPKEHGRSPVVLSAIKYLVARNRDIPIIGNITGPISLVTSIMDPLTIFRLLRKKPEEVELVLNYLTDYLIEFAREQVDAGADVIAIADPTATGEILGHVNFQRFVTPMLLRLVREIRAKGAGVIVHICGNATVLLPELRELRGAVLSFDSIVSLSKAKQTLGGIPVMGNVNTQLLHRGSPEKISQMTSLLVEQGIDIIAPACGISLATPVENLVALTNTVKKMKRP